MCCFSIFPSNFIVSGSGVPIGLCNHFRIRRTAHATTSSTRHSTHHTPFPVGTPLQVCISGLGHFLYRCSVVTKSVSASVFEIMGIKHNGVTTLTFQDHVTSSVTWSLDSQVAISYKSVCPAVFEIIVVKYWCHDFDLSGSRDVIGDVTIWLGIGHFLLVVLWKQVSISYGFRDILSQTWCAHKIVIAHDDLSISIFHPHFAYSLYATFTGLRRRIRGVLSRPLGLMLKAKSSENFLRPWPWALEIREKSMKWNRGKCEK